MKKVLVWLLIMISLAVLLIRFSSTAEELILGIKPKSGISIQSIPDGADVFLNGKNVGKTPYDNKELEVSEYLVDLRKEKYEWQGKIKLADGVITVVNRDLSTDLASQAGEILTLKKGKGMTVVSNPSDADVEVDGKTYGKTPQTLDISPGEHTLLLTHSNYLKRSIKANLPEDFNLTVAVDLPLSEVDLTSISTPVITQTPEVIVKSTPTGFLRVRDKASTAGREIAQVKTGETLILLEEQSGWDRIRLSDDTEGFVSSSYVEKKN